jgi:hypothetical protein
MSSVESLWTHDSGNEHVGRNDTSGSALGYSVVGYLIPTNHQFSVHESTRYCEYKSGENLGITNSRVLSLFAPHA